MPFGPEATMAEGPHRFEFDVPEGWERLPEGLAFVEVAGEKVDSRDRTCVFWRCQILVIVFDREGQLLTGWGRTRSRCPTASGSIPAGNSTWG